MSARRGQKLCGRSGSSERNWLARTGSGFERRRNGESSGKPEAQVHVDRQKAAQYGLDVTQIGNALRDAYQGNNDAKYREMGEQFDIRVQFADFDRSRIDQLGDMVVGRVNADGGRQAVRLSQVATVSMGPWRASRYPFAARARHQGSSSS